MYFCNALMGLMIVGRLSPMLQDLFGVSSQTGAIIVSINGAGF